MAPLITEKFKKTVIDKVVTEINSNTSNYFIITSRHQNWDNESSPTEETHSVEDSQLDIKRNMLYGKKVANTDVTFMLRKVPWGSNTVYTYYDHRNDNLPSNNFFIINSSNTVYKCIYNNGGEPSTVEPTSTPNTVFTLSDGYMWKYMYQVSSANGTKFSDDDFIPYDQDANVVNSAVDGAIHLIVVENGGSGWTTTSNGYIQQVLSNTLFRIADDTVSSVNGFLINSSMYIANGTGQGTISKITNYYSNSSGKYVATQNNITVDLTSGYIISPTVVIEGDGSNAVAYSTVDSNEKIDSIVMINEGQDYSFANVTILANTSFGSGANVVAIISPFGGHGADPVNELSGNHLGISVEFANSESNTIPTEVDFRQVALLVNPTAAGNSAVWGNTTFDQTVSFDVVTSNSSFSEDEIITGLSSGARGQVAFSNSSYVIATYMYGTFSNNETIIGSVTGVTGQISNINSPELNIQSGNVYYYENITSIQRSNTTSEVVKLIIEF